LRRVLISSITKMLTFPDMTVLLAGYCLMSDYHKHENI